MATNELSLMGETSFHSGAKRPFHHCFTSTLNKEQIQAINCVHFKCCRRRTTARSNSNLLLFQQLSDVVTVKKSVSSITYSWERNGKTKSPKKKQHNMKKEHIKICKHDHGSQQANFVNIGPMSSKYPLSLLS